MLMLREMLVEAEESRARGDKSYSIEEVTDLMEKAVREALNERWSKCLNETPMS